MRSTPRSSRRIRGGVVAVVLALTAAACGSTAETTADEPTDAVTATEEATTTAEAGETGGAGLPQLVGDTVRGAQLDTNDLAGQDVVVWFWAPW